MEGREGEDGRGSEFLPGEGEMSKLVVWSAYTAWVSVFISTEVWTEWVACRKHGAQWERRGLRKLGRITGSGKVKCVLI